MNRWLASGAVACWAASIGVLHAGCGAAHAQETEVGQSWSLLPLSVGNRWEYVRVVGDVWSEVVASIEVRDKVRIQASSSDTSSAGEYFEMHFTGRNNLFAGGQPEALFVQQDADGNIWTGAYLDRGQIHPTDGDQPWLLKAQWSWVLRLERFATLALDRIEWLGTDEEGLETWRGVDSGGEFVMQSSDSAKIAMARRLVPGFGLGGPWSLAWVHGIQSGVADGGDVNALFLAGVGPIQMAIPQWEPGPQVVLQLVRAEVNGNQYSLPRNTAILNGCWGHLKSGSSVVPPHER
ncbi:MAG: hypothetical protein WDA75_25720 [Candidatus Latescibacterota bacterium]|jgi:hypothetical protein